MRLTLDMYQHYIQSNAKKEFDYAREGFQRRGRGAIIYFAGEGGDDSRYAGKDDVLDIVRDLDAHDQIKSLIESYEPETQFIAVIFISYDPNHLNVYGILCKTGLDAKGRMN